MPVVVVSPFCGTWFPLAPQPNKRCDVHSPLSISILIASVNGGCFVSVLLDFSLITQYIGSYPTLRDITRFLLPQYWLLTFSCAMDDSSLSPQASLDWPSDFFFHTSASSCTHWYKSTRNSTFLPPAGLFFPPCILSIFSPFENHAFGFWVVLWCTAFTTMYIFARLCRRHPHGVPPSFPPFLDLPWGEGGPRFVFFFFHLRHFSFFLLEHCWSFIIFPLLRSSKSEDPVRLIAAPGPLYFFYNTNWTALPILYVFALPTLLRSTEWCSPQASELGQTPFRGPGKDFDMPSPALLTLFTACLFPNVFFSELGGVKSPPFQRGVSEDSLFHALNLWGPPSPPFSILNPWFH